MDNREPSLVPEWLRSSNHHLQSSSSHSDSASLSHNSKNRNSRSKSDVDSIRSPFLDRSSSTIIRRGSSNGSAKHAYSNFNFNRNHRDKDRSREKDRLSYVDPWDNDTSIHLGTFLNGRDPEQLRRSQSLISRKQGDHLVRGLTVGLKNGGSINTYNGDGILYGPKITNSPKKTVFDKDFPSLGAEERNGTVDVIRVSSPGLTPTVQSLPMGKSGLIVGDGWTSALAEVPGGVEKTGAGSLPSVHANVGSSCTLIGSTGLNMAEALVHAPARAGTPPQGSVKTQRLEDRAMKQSRQLIPVVPSTPKGSVLNSSDKSKTKLAVRTGETGLASLRSTQQQSSVLLSNLQSNPGGQIKPDTTKKLVVLKPARENGVATAKESGSSSGISNSRAATSHFTTPQCSQSAPVRSTNSPRVLKGNSLNTIAGNTIEKKPSLAQTQSRHAFYSALKQQTSTITSTDPANTTSCICPSVEETANSCKELVASDPSSPQAADVVEVTSMEKVSKVLSEVVEKNNGFESPDIPDEKEAKFLRSLGWDENNIEDEALRPLTEEEIRGFYIQCMKVKPSLVQKLPITQEEHLTPDS